MTTPEIKSNAPIKATPGMSIKTIQNRGTEAQRVAASLFDTQGEKIYHTSDGRSLSVLGGDGKLNEEECNLFNSYNMDLTDLGNGSKKLTMKNGDKTIEVIYDNLEELEFMRVSNNKITQISSDSGSFAGICDIKYSKEDLKFKNLLFDLTNNKFEVKGAIDAKVVAYQRDLSVKDSTIENLQSRYNKTTLENTKVDSVFVDEASVSRKNSPIEKIENQKEKL